MSSVSDTSKTRREVFSSSRADAVYNDNYVGDDDDDDNVFPEENSNSFYSTQNIRAGLLQNIPIESESPAADPRRTEHPQCCGGVEPADKVLCRSRSVHFKEDGKETNAVSEHGREVRNSFRKSSGYGTGESSQQSKSSQKSGTCDVATGSSVTQAGDDTGDSPSHRTEPFPEGNLPNLSIFKTEASWKSRTASAESAKNDNIQDEMIFRENSRGSLQFNSGNLSPTASVTSYTENSPSPPFFTIFDERVLEEFMQQRHSRHDDVSADTAAMLTHHSLMQDKQCLLDAYMANEHVSAEDVFNLMSESSPSPGGQNLSPLVMKYLDEIYEESCSSTEQSTIIDFETADDAGVVDDELVINLEKAYRCQDQTCTEDNCYRIKERIKGFKETVRGEHPLVKSDVDLLYGLRAHSERCDSLKCYVPWSWFLHTIDPWDVADAVSEIFNDLESPTLRLSEPAYQKCLQFESTDDVLISSGSFIEGEDWQVLSPLTESRTVMLVNDLSCGKAETRVVKKAILLDYDHQWKVYENLRALRWIHVVRHHWMVEQDNCLLICTEFIHGGTLQHMIESNPLGHDEVIFFMKQILEGIQSLHEKNIVYLYWTSSNMLLVDKGTVKISNLTMSVSLDYKVEYQEVKQGLPAVILPPELLQQDVNLSLTSDSWGCGCLILELLTGTRVWNRLRHERQETIWKKLLRKTSPPVPRNAGSLINVFEVCWKKCQNDRKTIGEIQQMFR